MARVVSAEQVTTHWKCESCGHEVEWPLTSISRVGTPICGQDDCNSEGDDMTLMDKVEIEGENNLAKNI